VGQKVTGAFLNALVFVLMITVMTFGLYVLFRYRCNKCIYGYLGFSGFSILFFMGGYILQTLLNNWQLPFDAISFVFLLYNFAAVGMFSMFFIRVPMALKQAYLVIVAVIIAVLFTRIPEWTTWFMLFALVIYDLCAVLLPGGPLRVLVELAVEREEAIPALVYESRVRRRPSQGEEVHMDTRRPGSTPSSSQTETPDREEEASSPPSARPSRDISRDPVITEEQEETSQHQPLIHHRARPSEGGENCVEEPDMHELPDSIKLGLGDFIFYSVLVGRASLYDMTTVFVCYLAIMAGLGTTLFLLAIYQKALPALPISITLGIICYFCARFFLDPIVTPMSVSLLYA